MTPRTNDLSRFRYTSPAWWEGFMQGRRMGRTQAAADERKAGLHKDADRQEAKAKELEG